MAVCIEGSRSYGIGLARALAAAGLLVLECEQPSRKQRRGKGKSDSVDAHLAVLAALRLDTGRLPVPRADGDREALRILLVARQEMTAALAARAATWLRDRRRHRERIERGGTRGSERASLTPRSEAEGQGPPDTVASR